MIWSESEIMEKEINVNCIIYENAIDDIESSFFMEYDASDETESGLRRCVDSVKKKISEIIEKIKDFFANLYERHKINKLKKQLSSEIAKSNKLVPKKLDSKLIMSNIDKTYKAYQDALKSMKNVYNSYKNNSITHEQFTEKITLIYNKLNNSISTYKISKEDAIKNVPEVQSIPMKNITDQLSQIMNSYETKISSMQKEIISYEETLQKENDEKTSKIANAKMKISSLASKISPDVLTAIGAIAGVGFLMYAGKKMDEHKEEKYAKAEKEHGKEYADQMRYDEYVRNETYLKEHNLASINKDLDKLHAQYRTQTMYGTSKVKQQELKKKINALEKERRSEERRSASIHIKSKDEWMKLRSK